MSRDLPGVDPATLNGILLYYCLMTKWSGLGDSMELSRVGLSQLHKLSSPWEGPFSVSKVNRPGSYRLQTLERDDISNSWNVDQLVTSTRSRLTTLQVQVYTTTYGLFAVTAFWSWH
jgi:hypothetical protein